MGDLEKYSLWEQQYVEGLSGSGHELWVRACAVGPGMSCGSRHALWVRACAVGPGMRCGSGHGGWVQACTVGPGMRCGSGHVLGVGGGFCTATLSQCYGAAGGRARGGEGRRM